MINICLCFNFRFGGRFFALNNCYDPSLRKMAKEVANEIGMQSSFHEGVYAMLGGPNFGNLNKKIQELMEIIFKKFWHLYINNYGNNYILETVAELRMLQTCGVDAVGTLIENLIFKSLIHFTIKIDFQKYKWSESLLHWKFFSRYEYYTRSTSGMPLWHKSIRIFSNHQWVHSRGKYL